MLLCAGFGAPAGFGAGGISSLPNTVAFPPDGQRLPVFQVLSVLVLRLQAPQHLPLVSLHKQVLDLQPMEQQVMPLIRHSVKYPVPHSPTLQAVPIQALHLRLVLELSPQPAMLLDEPQHRQHQLLDNQAARNPWADLALVSHKQQQALVLELPLCQQPLASVLVSPNHQLALHLARRRHQHLEDLVSPNQQQPVGLVSHHRRPAVLLALARQQLVLALALGQLNQVLQCLVRLRLSVLQHRQHQLLGQSLVSLHQVTAVAVCLR